jgi:hypothetical protein
MATNVAFDTANMVTLVKTIFESTSGGEEMEAEQRRKVNQSGYRSDDTRR